MNDKLFDRLSVVISGIIFPIFLMTCVFHILSIVINIEQTMRRQYEEARVNEAWKIITLGEEKNISGRLIDSLEFLNLISNSLAGISIPNSYLEGIKLLKADLRLTNFREVNLSKANLSKANLSGANLIGADLSEANLSEANLSGANLIGANLSEANLFEANLKGVIYTNKYTEEEVCKKYRLKHRCSTKFPKEYNINENGMMLVKDIRSNNNPEKENPDGENSYSKLKENTKKIIEKTNNNISIIPVIPFFRTSLVDTLKVNPTIKFPEKIADSLIDFVLLGEGKIEIKLEKILEWTLELNNRKLEVPLAIETIYFEFDGDTVTEGEQYKLKDFIFETIDKKPKKIDIILNCYTDTFGSVDYNQELSRRRCKAVKKFLNTIEVRINNNIEYIEIIHGEFDFSYLNKDETKEPGRRRVDITIIKKDIF